jgi:hypothetical protein
MVMKGHIWRLKASNYLNVLTQTFDEELNIEQLIE